MSARRAALDIRVAGQGAPPAPISRFGQCGFDAPLLRHLKQRGFEAPTAVQAQALPAVLSGRDVLCVAKTGSGKTLAYLLPLVPHVLARGFLPARFRLLFACFSRAFACLHRVLSDTEARGFRECVLNVVERPPFEQRPVRTSNRTRRSWRGARAPSGSCSRPPASSRSRCAPPLPPLLPPPPPPPRRCLLRGTPPRFPLRFFLAVVPTTRVSFPPDHTAVARIAPRLPRRFTSRRGRSRRSTPCASPAPTAAPTRRSSLKTSRPAPRRAGPPARSLCR